MGYTRDSLVINNAIKCKIKNFETKCPLHESDGRVSSAECKTLELRMLINKTSNCKTIVSCKQTFESQLYRRKFLS